MPNIIRIDTVGGLDAMTQYTISVPVTVTDSFGQPLPAARPTPSPPATDRERSPVMKTRTFLIAGALGALGVTGLHGLVDAPTARAQSTTTGAIQGQVVDSRPARSSPA